MIEVALTLISSFGFLWFLAFRQLCFGELYESLFHIRYPYAIGSKLLKSPLLRKIDLPWRGRNDVADHSDREFFRGKGMSIRYCSDKFDRQEEWSKGPQQLFVVPHSQKWLQMKCCYGGDSDFSAPWSLCTHFPPVYRLNLLKILLAQISGQWFPPSKRYRDFQTANRFYFHQSSMFRHAKTELTPVWSSMGMDYLVFVGSSFSFDEFPPPNCKIFLSR